MDKDNKKYRSKKKSLYDSSYMRKRTHGENYSQNLKKYKINKVDEKIIRRYILLLQDTAPVEYLIKVMAYVFRTNVENVHRILSGTTSMELCEIAMLRKNSSDSSKRKRNAERSIGYNSVLQRGDCNE